MADKGMDKGGEQKMDKQVKNLAKYEIEWWKAHHRKDQKKFLDNMTRLYMQLYGLTYKVAEMIIGYRVEAAKFHDMAEKHEDAGNQKEADKNWRLAEEKLQFHFDLLLKQRRR